MAFLAPWGLSRWAMAVPGLLSKIFTYTHTDTHTQTDRHSFHPHLHTQKKSGMANVQELN